MMPGGKPFGWILFLLLPVFLWCSCSQPPEKEVTDYFYMLTPEGTFDRTESHQGLSAAEFLPWPRQIRVTDLCVFRGKTYLAVNGHGIAVAEVADRAVAITPWYSSNYFSGRSLTRFFSRESALYCHVYFDASFPASRPLPPPAARFGLVRIMISPSGLDYVPRSLLFQGKDEPWEAVGAGALDRDTLVLEWKLTQHSQTRFRYSTINLTDSGEEEQNREWFYAHASASPPTAAADPTAAALMDYAVGRLAKETPGCVVLFNLVEGAGGADRRFVFRDDDGRHPSSVVYHEVRLTRTPDVCSLLLADGRFILARSAARAEWREGRLPELPADCRYQALAVNSGFLCAAWEQVNFYRVGRAGIVIRPGDY